MEPVISQPLSCIHSNIAEPELNLPLRTELIQELILDPSQEGSPNSNLGARTEEAAG